MSRLRLYSGLLGPGPHHFNFAGPGPCLSARLRGGGFSPSASGASRPRPAGHASCGAASSGIQVGPFFPRPRISVGSGRMCLVPFVLVTSPCPFQKPPGEVSFQPASLTPECASVSESRDSCMPSPLRRWRTRPAGRPPAWRLRRVTAHHTRIVWLAGPTRGNP